MVEIYGYKPPSGGAPAFAVTGVPGNPHTRNQICYVADPMPEHGWFYAMAARLGKLIGEPDATVSLAGWAPAADGEPDALICRTPSFTVLSAMSYGGDGVVTERALQAAAKGRSAKRYAAGLLATNGRLGFGMIAAAAITADDETFYYRGRPSQPPTDPFGHTSAEFVGHAAIWFLYQANAKPSTPTNRSPSANAQIATLTPTLSFDASDPDEVLPNGLAGDSIDLVQYKVVRVSNGQVVWDEEYSPSAGERSSHTFARDYDGVALIAGQAYDWQARCADEFGAWGNWSSPLRFTVGGGAVGRAGTFPTGRQTTQTPAPFTGTWTHQAGLAADRVQMRLVDGNGAVLHTSPEIVQAVANGGTISISWAQSTLGLLVWGRSWGSQIRARDTGGTWSDWSTTRSFTTNAAPAIPVALSPAGGVVTSSLPVLRCVVTDADDDPATLTVKARIKSAVGAVLQTRTMTYNAANGAHEYQTVAVDMTAGNDYRWDAYAGDGHGLWSGGRTVEANAATSAEALLTYGTGPAVAITAPTYNQVVTTDQPVFAWTAAGQVSYKIILTNVATGTRVVPSDTVVSAAQTYTPPAGRLRNGTTYDLVVVVTDTDGLTGTSPPVRFALQYTDLTLVYGFTAAPRTRPDEPAATAVILSWEPSYLTGQFERYRITRKFAADAIAADPTLDPGWRIIASIPSQSQTTYVDDTLPSGVDVEYGIRQVMRIGADRVQSPRSTVAARIDFTGIVIVSKAHPSSERVFLQHRDSDLAVTWVTNRRKLQAWGQRRPTILADDTLYRELEVTCKEIVAGSGDFRRLVASIEALMLAEGPFLIRDSSGLAVWGEPDAPKATRKLHVPTATVAWKFVETSYADEEEI